MISMSTAQSDGGKITYELKQIDNKFCVVDALDPDTAICEIDNASIDQISGMLVIYDDESKSTTAVLAPSEFEVDSDGEVLVVEQYKVSDQPIIFNKDDDDNIISAQLNIPASEAATLFEPIKLEHKISDTEEMTFFLKLLGNDVVLTEPNNVYNCQTNFIYDDSTQGISETQIDAQKNVSRKIILAPEDILLSNGHLLVKKSQHLSAKNSDVAYNISINDVDTDNHTVDATVSVKQTKAAEALEKQAKTYQDELTAGRIFEVKNDSSCLVSTYNSGVSKIVLQKNVNGAIQPTATPYKIDDNGNIVDTSKNNAILFAKDDFVTNLSGNIAVFQALGFRFDAQGNLEHFGKILSASEANVNDYPSKTNGDLISDEYLADWKSLEVANVKYDTPDQFKDKRIDNLYVYDQFGSLEQALPNQNNAIEHPYRTKLLKFHRSLENMLKHYTHTANRFAHVNPYNFSQELHFIIKEAEQESVKEWNAIQQDKSSNTSDVHGPLLDLHESIKNAILSKFHDLKTKAALLYPAMQLAHSIIMDYPLMQKAEANQAFGAVVMDKDCNVVSEKLRNMRRNDLYSLIERGILAKAYISITANQIENSNIEPLSNTLKTFLVNDLEPKLERLKEIINVLSMNTPEMVNNTNGKEEIVVWNEAYANKAAQNSIEKNKNAGGFKTIQGFWQGGLSTASSWAKEKLNGQEEFGKTVTAVSKLEQLKMFNVLMEKMRKLNANKPANQKIVKKSDSLLANLSASLDAYSEMSPEYKNYTLYFEPVYNKLLKIERNVKARQYNGTLETYEFLEEAVSAFSDAFSVTDPFVSNVSTKSYYQEQDVNGNITAIKPSWLVKIAEEYRNAIICSYHYESDSMTDAGRKNTFGEVDKTSTPYSAGKGKYQPNDTIPQCPDLSATYAEGDNVIPMYAIDPKKPAKLGSYNKFITDVKVTGEKFFKAKYGVVANHNKAKITEVEEKNLPAISIVP